MPQEPIELLEERLREIEAVGSGCPEVERYRRMYMSSIEHLRSYFFYDKKDNRRALTDYEVKLVEEHCNFGQVEYFAGLLNVSKHTIEKVLKNRKDKIREDLKRKMNRL